MAAGDSIPLQNRIELGEAVIELVCEELRKLDPTSFDGQRRILELTKQMNDMLEELLPFYDQRLLEAASS